MLKQFLTANFSIQCKKGLLARRTNFCSVSGKSIRNASSNNHNDDDFDEPIKYSTSQAATWSAAKSRNPLIERHPHESTVVTFSLFVFLLYFLVFREENDIDLLLDMDLTERVPGLLSAMTENNIRK